MAGVIPRPPRPRQNPDRDPDRDNGVHQDCADKGSPGPGSDQGFVAGATVVSA
jgi:hypothetical protein